MIFIRSVVSTFHLAERKWFDEACVSSQLFVTPHFQCSLPLIILSILLLLFIHFIPHLSFTVVVFFFSRPVSYSLFTSNAPRIMDEGNTKRYTSTPVADAGRSLHFSLTQTTSSASFNAVFILSSMIVYTHDHYWVVSETCGND